MAPPPAPTPSYARLPEQYDVDDAFTARLFPGYKRKGIPTPMFGNIKHENCVIAGRAHQTLRSRLAERKCLIKVTNQDVMNEFKKETGGKDQPISVLHSLKRWRCVGWKVAGETRKIKFFARLNKRDHEKIKRAISIDIGVGLGLMLPDSAITQFFDEYGKPKPLSQREPWEVSPNGGEESLKHIGHYVYVTGYTKRGPVCVTWGRKQQMSWAFVNKYCDEAYAIIDAINTPEKKRFLDEKKIKRFLEMCDEHEEGS